MATSLTPYGNGNGNSGIIGYEIGDGWMEIEYANGGIYTYTEANIGEVNFLKMKVLALEGSGLNAFINKEVRGRGRRRFTETAPVKDTTISITTTAKEAVAIVTELLKNFDVDVNIS